MTTRTSRSPIDPRCSRCSPRRTPARSWRASCGITLEINGRAAPVYRILESAAASDPEAGPLLDELTRQRTQGQRIIARSLARRGALRAGLRERDAADLIHALASPELYRLLVVDREWKVERYERWLCETLCSQLLPSSDRWSPDELT